VVVSYVLRLISEELAEGRLVGDVEAVATGQHRAVNGAEELLSFCAETCRPGSSGGGV